MKNVSFDCAMPGLIVYRRRWLAGSDDLIVPAAFFFILHFICLTMLGVSFLQYIHRTVDESNKLLYYLMLTYVVITLISMSSELGMCATSMRGSILDTKAREPIKIWIYLKTLALILTFVWLLLSTVWLFKYYLNEPTAEAESIFFAVFICQWMQLIFTLILIWCFYDAAGATWVNMQRCDLANDVFINKCQSKMRHAYESTWENRCHRIFCCMKKSAHKHNSFAEIARLLSNFFIDVDVVTSDMVAGLVLLRKFQKLERESNTRRGKNGIVAYLSGVPVTPQTQYLDEDSAKTYEFLQTAIHYLYYAQGAYGWLVFVLLNRSKIWQLLKDLKCFSCCCVRRLNAVVSKDNCCYCNYTALRKTLEARDCEVTYATYHTDIGQSPFFVAIDYNRKKIVVSVRGTLSMSEILTDLNAEGVVFHVCPTTDEEWLGHRGMVEAAKYVQRKLLDEQLIDSALERNRDKKTHTFDLMIVGHSLGAGIAAILAVLLKPSYPTLHCYCYAPLGGTLSMSAVEYSKSFITTFVLGKDIVPRLGLNQCKALRADLINALQHCIDSKWSTISYSILCCRCQCEPKSVSNMQGQDALIMQYQEQRQTERLNQLHIVPRQLQDLHLPGRILHIGRQHANQDGVAKKRRKPIYKAIWAETKDFDEVLVSPVMLQDHMSEQLQYALQEILSKMEPIA